MVKDNSCGNSSLPQADAMKNHMRASTMNVKSDFSTQASGDQLTDAASVKALKSKPGMVLPPAT